MTTSQLLPAPRKRPAGIYIVCLLLLLIAVVHAYDVYRLTQGLPALLHPNIGDQTVRFSMSGAFTAVSVFCIVGLLARRTWAWHLTMILLGIGLFINIWAYLIGREPFVSMILQALAVLYLNLRDVQDYFKTAEPGLVTEAK